MNKIVSLFVVLCGISLGYSIPIQNALMYYRHAMPYMVPHQAMYGFHYQNQQLRNQHRSAGVSAFAAGNTIAAGTYLKDCKTTDIESAEQPVQNDPNVQSTAEAYPEEQFHVEDEPQYETPIVNDQEAIEPIADEPAAIPAAVPAVPAVIPDKRKKVQLDSDEDETAVYPSRRGASRPAEPSSYFPINFGGTSGGAIAIANSYSTGKGGSATSTATAYGSPTSSELRRATQPAQLKKKPAKLRARKY
ncbi:uncharacterized protein LOC129723309 isoform X1 [Wyeomyia smithii]|uniref:uncharacterized protein LOC129723309 isoform X1 n=1 Tax=Wyeomyia smithii TaxID=174621 RepID=UPI002467FF34|nr:uncharacterized protein LOC129723309 isoform X1 [Wyeomyia smithii]